ncbi:MAG TPA: hypothetical protein PKA16_05495 [Ottowia sp.]|uniref:hypothetical protein n=1 Tax=Ottowia sp. TaxID=1898956 RepID=UPI002C82E892|nr:hypothetical protein [Ottowia sp.]HMN20829.1 hypothetical protein [Ottowia sp.]
MSVPDWDAGSGGLKPAAPQNTSICSIFGFTCNKMREYRGTEADQLDPIKTTGSQLGSAGKPAFWVQESDCKLVKLMVKNTDLI